MSKVIFQTGVFRGKKRRQSVKVFINGEEADRSDNDNGKFLTARTDYQLKGMLWYMNSYDLEDGDQIKLEVETWILCSSRENSSFGKEENLSFEHMYVVDSTADVEEVNMPSVGMKNYPLLKGRISEIYSLTEDDKRKQEIEDFISEGF